jgi:hypothetical protein
VSIRHYRDLAVFGERILLSVRWVDWSNITDHVSATSWSTFWRSEIQTVSLAQRRQLQLHLACSAEPHNMCGHGER